MTNITSQLKFNGKWRIYQKRVLDQLELHFEDKRLHIVAAPGAGKTTLGIEVIRRLGNPTLILSPTIVIKNQWKYRILDDFCDETFNSNEISTTLEEVKDITTGTYQRLQAIEKKGLLEEFVYQLRERGVKTIVLDEAHHLRTEWHKTLVRLINSLAKDQPDFKIIALTATPPYDVEEKEWKKYYNICGEIDAEISIPELVQHEDLCPHQDLLFFSNLNDEEKKIVYDYTTNRDAFFKYLNNTSDLLYSIETSMFFNDLEKNFDLIFEDTDFTISLISYLFSIDSTHYNGTCLMNFLELKREQIPKFDYEIAEDLFNGIIGKFKKYFKNSTLLKNKLKEFNLLKNASRVDFSGKTNFKKLFARSENKLDSIKRITLSEYFSLSENLREVILLDFIGSDTGVHGLNILSAFKKLNEEKPKDLKIAVLTGSIIIIPKSTKDILNSLLKEQGIGNNKILYTEYNEEYLRVETYGEVDIVAMMTEVFSKGGINVLIGTHSLLGEGWDSPCINTLVIGSVVGSFMLSNQIRGRALRRAPNNPEKTANIWHLLSIESKFERGYDYRTIRRRFETFDGISYVTDSIENGFERLGYDYANYNSEKKDELNTLSIDRALKRGELKEIWNKCLKGGKFLLAAQNKKMQESININFFQDAKFRIHRGQKSTTGEFSYSLLSIFIIWQATIIYLISHAVTAGGSGDVLGLIGIIPITFLLLIACCVMNLNTKDNGIYSIMTRFYKSVFPCILASSYIVLMFSLDPIVLIYFPFFMAIPIILFHLMFKLSYPTILKNKKCHPTEAISYAVLQTLCELTFLAPIYKLPLTINKNKDNSITIDCHENKYMNTQWSQYTKKEFKTAYMNVFYQDDTKYLIKLKNFEDKYLNVPNIFANTKENVQIFAKNLEVYFGEVEVISTLEKLGKRELLKARYNQFINAQVSKKRVWRPGK